MSPICLLQQELRDYYATRSHKVMQDTHFLQPWLDRFNAYADAHPEQTPMQWRATQYEMIADGFTPVLFRHSPFYSEMDIKMAEYDGTPGVGVGGWLYTRLCHRYREADEIAYEQYRQAGKQSLHLIFGPYADYDHHCFPYSNVMRHGLGFYCARAESERVTCRSEAERQYLDTTVRALRAVGEAAQRRLPEAMDEEERENLVRIARTAPEVPWRPPATFYEGIQTLWFLHEVCASMEGVGMSVVGHYDRLLGELYRQDVESGALSREQAYNLLCRMLVYVDGTYDSSAPVAESFNNQEQGNTLILGGCDAEGREVFNAVTELILEAHDNLKLIYPKLHCRISVKSSRAYLNAINRTFLSGRNVLSFLNDDAIIPAQQRAGKSLEDARRYVSGGCWEVIIEGSEHSAGANCYFNLPRVLDLSIHDSSKIERETGEHFDSLDGACDFEAVYRIAMGNVTRSVRKMCQTIGANGRVLPDVFPAPLFSACLDDCIANRRDYTAGGGRYNPHGAPMAGFAIFVDSLLAVQHLCFDSHVCALEELLRAVRVDWVGFEALRARATHVPCVGDCGAASTALGQRVIDDLAAAIRDLRNERDGPFQLGFYNYRDVIDWACVTRALPNGRRAGDFLSTGITPSRFHEPESLTTVINSFSALDLTEASANSVLTLSVARHGLSREILESLERVFAASRAGMLQLNCIDPDELEDARRNPHRHQNLIVRLYGFSARFVCLTPAMQQEFISRIVYGT